MNPESEHVARRGPLAVSAHGPALSRREFVRSAGIAAVGVVAPFSFVRSASARTDRLHRYLKQKLAECNTPGIAVAVVRGDEVVFADGVGWADREHRLRVTSQTPFMLASVSKTITCAGIMALVEDGRLDLDADINGYLPFEVHIPKTARCPDHDADAADAYVGDPRSMADLGNAVVRPDPVLPWRLADRAR
jgi:CubicO group peptidase (beta-lactamase class C family)